MAAPAAPSDDFQSLDHAAIAFITVDDDDKFEVNPEAVRYLKSLTGKIAAVSIAGIYRTGKSYLLNQLMGRANGFTVGPTVKACTKGIWLWGKGISVEGADMTVLFMDTEGLGSTVRSENYDARIFALALLLSSYFIYNSFGTIDGNAVSKLSLVVNLTKHIHVRSQGGGGGGGGKSEDSGTEYNQFFPHFLWVVRDFSVKLEREGRKISAREYLEDALKPEEGLSEAVESKNSVRMLIRNFFPERDCVTMVRPVADEKALMALGSLPPEALRPEFRAQIDALRKRIMTTARPKTLYGKPLTGAMLASLAEAYVGAINVGGTPTIASAWDRVVETQCRDAVEAAAKLYVDRMHVALAAAHSRRLAALGAAPRPSGGASPAPSPTSLPSTGSLLRAGATPRDAGVYAAESTIADAEEVQAAHADCGLAAVRLFEARAVQDPDKTPPFEDALRRQLEDAHAALRRANDAASAAFCLELLERLHARAVAAMAALSGSERATPGGGAAGGGRRASATGGAGARGVRRRQAGGGAGDSDDDDDGGDGLPRGGDGSARRAAGAGGSSSSAPADATPGTAAIAAARDAVVPASVLARAYRDAVEAVNASYVDEAAGPARHRVLGEYLLNKLPLLLADAGFTVDERYGQLASAYGARIRELSGSLAAAQGREKSASELLAAERKSFEAGLAEQTRQAADTSERLKASLEARAAEVDRLSTRYDKLLAAHEAASVRADEAAARAASDLAAAYRRTDEVQAARLGTLLDVGVAATRVADAEAARGDAERLAADLRLRLAEETKAAAVLLERCRAAENETVRLREQTELLYESVRVQRDLLAAKNDEKEECEFQWGVAKAKLAQAESEKLAMEADLAALTTVASHMKGALAKAGKGTSKALGLDRTEQRVFDGIQAGAA